MKSITIHGLDGPLDKRIREKARQMGLSLNKTIKKLLAESVGLQEPEPRDHREEFLDLFGIWTKEEAEDFHKNIREIRKLDPEDWT
jgi:hypothetical protein